MSLSQNQIQDAINAHLDIQTGNYLSAVVPGVHGSYAFSDYIYDFYWNYAIHLQATDPNEIETLITSASEFFRNRGAVPCFYVDPTSVPNNFDGLLPGFAKATEVWMFFRGETPEEEIPQELQILRVNSLSEMQTFVEVFNQSYGGGAPSDEGYSGLSPAYGESLLRAFQNQRTGYETIHYLGYWNGEPVGIASLYSDGRRGGIYNVGTIPQARCNGIGSALSLEAVKDSLKRKHEYLFLQTEYGGSVERFYTRLGFVTEFTGDFYYQE